MSLTTIPSYQVLTDGQFLQIEGPDGITTGYHFDQQQRALYFKESQVIFPRFHGPTHVAEDPVPNATTDTPGLLSADDKIKLDSLLQTRIGVAGFAGAGFPDDGGWLQEDIILAAGTDFISIERIGNVIRFTIDSPVPLNCTCFVPGARVLMANGTTKPIEHIRVGDWVVTHLGHIRKVVNTFRTPFEGPLVRWKVDKHSGDQFGITANHPVYSLQQCQVASRGTTRKHGGTSPEFKNAGDIPLGGLVARRRSHDQLQDVRVIDIMAELENYEEGELSLVYPPRYDSAAERGTALPRHIEVSADFLQLLGYYAATGSADVRSGIRFQTQCIEPNFKDVGADISLLLCNLLGLEPKIRGKATPTGRDVCVHNKPLRDLFAKWFGKRRGRCFPDWLMSLPPVKQAQFAAAFLRSTGYIVMESETKSKLVLETRYRNMFDQLLFLAERCGWEPHHHPTTSVDGRPMYSLSIPFGEFGESMWSIWDDLIKSTHTRDERDVASGGQILHRITERSRPYYKGFVHNFEVQEDNSYVVDSVVVHNCEECNKIFWVQDETDVSAIRVPTCGGKLPGINGYGELKIYLFPESTIVSPTNSASTLNQKGNYPTLIFKRYDDTIVPGSAEFDMVLKRDSNNVAQAEIGWAMTPGASGIAQCVWWVGKDDDGNQLRFDLVPDLEPGLLGAMLYNGHLVTKKMAVITGYASTILSTNQYTCREWDVTNHKALGDSFTATNVWYYTNPENPSSGTTPQALVLDGTIDLLPVGTLVDMWFFKVGETAGVPIRRYYFSKRPHLNPTHLWSCTDAVQFGDVATARQEQQADAGSDDADSAVVTSAARDFEQSMWGLTGRDDPLISFEAINTGGTGTSADLNRQHRAFIDTALPGLVVQSTQNVPVDNFSERPVHLWARKTFCGNALFQAAIGRPAGSNFTPYDIILRGKIDEHTEKYMRVVTAGTAGDSAHYIEVCGAAFHDLPSFGTVRVISPSDGSNVIFNYTRKLMFPRLGGTGDDTTSNCDTVILSGTIPYTGNVGDVVELLHQEYSTPVVRLEFTFDSDTDKVELQFKVGTLDMSARYENDDEDTDLDDYVRGLAAGYAVSALYSQEGIFTGVGDQPTSTPDDFVVYEGGVQSGGDQAEYWNELEVMLRNDQVWIWWNRLLVPPSATLSGNLATPVDVDTPYFPIDSDATNPFGKVGMRLWPGAAVRRVQVYNQVKLFSEFSYGQLTIDT